MSQRYQVIAIDPRSIGESGRPQSGYDTQTAARDVKGLMEQLGLKQIFLVGHDVGTRRVDEKDTSARIYGPALSWRLTK